MEEFNCHYCNRNFSCKTALNKHKFGSCIWLHSSKKEKLQEIDALEPLMTDRQRDTMLRHLLLQMTKMNDKMNNMQKELTYLKQKQKMSIVRLLNSSETKPTKTFNQWFKSLTITQRHLEMVFQRSLLDAMVCVILDDCESAKILQRVIPIKAFNQKLHTLYVYTEKDDCKKWDILDGKLLQKMCSILASKFSELFLQWQCENLDYISSSTDTQEQEMTFMTKIMDETYKRKNSYFTDKIHAQIQVDFQVIDFE
jgi:hypothetical protein